MNDKGLTIPGTVIQQFILSSGAVQNNKSNLETLARIFVEIIGGLVKASISASDKQKLRNEDIVKASRTFHFKPFFAKSDKTIPRNQKPGLCAKSYKNGDIAHYQAVRNCVFTRPGTFKRVVRTLMKHLGHSEMKVSSPALGEMQKTAESLFRHFLNETVRTITKDRISMKRPDLVRKVIDTSYTAFKKRNKVMSVARLLTNKHKMNNSTCDKLIGLIRDLKQQITKLQDKFERLLQGGPGSERAPPTPGKVNSSSQTESLRQSDSGSSDSGSSDSGSSDSGSSDSGSGPGPRKSDTSNNDEEMFMLNNLRNLQEQNTKLQRQLNQEKTDKENYQKMFEILQESLENQPSPTSVQSENATNDTSVQSDLTSDDIDNLENDLAHQKVLNMNDKTRSKNAMLDQELEALTERMKSNAAAISDLQDQELETVTERVRGLNQRQQLINQGTGIISNLQNQIQELKSKAVNDTQTTGTQTEIASDESKSSDSDESKSSDSDDSKSSDSDDSGDSDSEDSRPRRDSGYNSDESDDQVLRDKWFALKNSLPEDIKKAAFGNLDYYDPFKIC
ncbi:hypothetical protein EBU95_13710 [bacterium]|nr:hypothetical protein [bacterium]